MRTFENAYQYPDQQPRGQQILAIVSGWSPEPYPVHRSLEREAAEQIDISERDFAARQVFAGRAAR